MTSKLVNSKNTSESNMENEELEFVSLLRKVLGSCNINFLFGAGVNGKAFPNFAKFVSTKETMHSHGLEGDDIEKALQNCDDEQARSAILDAFITEFNAHNNYSLNHESLINLRDLIKATHKAVKKTENRHPESKRVNIFTLNYDRIVEEVLEASGIFNYTLKSETKSFLPFNVVGYNTETRSFVPTFAVYKLHGSVDPDRTLQSNGIVFPGQDKLGSVVSNFYETLFAMKGELLRKNAVLFVIGYSWSDAHVNDIIRSAIDSGLTVIFPQYSTTSKMPDELKDDVIILPPANVDPPCDTTKTLAELFDKAMI